MATHKPLPANNYLEAITANLSNPETGWYRYHCKLVTPMYGGGVEAGKVDEKMPIRATAIRGQLRFWWRLAHRSQFADSQAMFQRERELWGGLGNAEELAASKVVVKVLGVHKLSVEPCAVYERNKDGKYRLNWKPWADSYTMFPAQGKAPGAQDSKNPGKMLKPGAEWDVEVNLPALNELDGKEVEIALKWWATFGGVGARTRRGLGAVEVRDKSKNELLRVTEDDIKAMPEFALKFKRPAATATEAWKQAVNAMKEFRQAPNVGRNPASKGSRSPAGRSRWPEPDTIREITRLNSGRHPIEHMARGVFPRAAFGLPIIFHYQGEGEPGDTELAPEKNGQKLDRMASPIILRPYPNSDGKWHAAALHLPDDHVWATDIQLSNSGKGRSPCLPKSFAADVWWPKGAAAETKSKLIAPLMGLGNDPISVLMEFFGEQKSIQGQKQSVPIADSDTAQTESHLIGVQVKFNRANGSISVKSGNLEIFALNDAAKALLESLSPVTQQKIKQHRFVKVNAVIVGREIKSLEEIK